ncbi:rho GTPase-activating protein 190-like isoform X6 [Mytilus californianus]|uniref:rho GTPase-activating protein 190-like isoform X6 n=1 Tax=Mytilus californianus TaxID=6549 RepID=UPI002246F592|nr:rho GTPase-activating protein 190-like isoform X6 [Mytilus californianus]
MAKKTDDRTFNVSVIGLSGTEKDKGPIGVGKSCFCNRFICQVADKYSHDHISVLSQSDFAGRVINNDHFLYWGEVTKTDDGSNFTFHVIEQTEFIDDVSFQPFKTGRTDPYHKRCIMTKVQSAEKLMYICKDQLGMETDSSYEQKIMPDGKLNIDGFICCFDVSQIQQRTLEHQVDFVIHLLNGVLKNKKPVVLVTTKTDEGNERYLKEAEKIVARKEYKNNIPLIGTSAHENVNIELAFMTLAHLIDKTKTRPKIIPFSEAVKQRKEILDVATEAYKSLLKLQVIDSKAIWSPTKRKLEKESDFGHYVDLFGTDSAKRLFRRHIAYLRDEQIKKREQFFLKKLPETINHFLPDLISINDKPWSGCQRYIADHPDYDTYFIEVAPGDESWKSKQDFVENYSELRIPFDLLNSSDAEKCFRNHLDNLQAEYRKSQLKKKFKIALEENQHVIPGKGLEETYIFFVGKECYNDLLSQEREQVYEQHQAELRQKAKLEFQELLWEKLELFIRMIGTSDTYTQEDIKSITKDLEDDLRYRKLDKMEGERNIMLLNHLGFMECPSKDRCHFREKCAENKVQLLLASRPVRPEPQTITQPTECSPLNLVLLGKDGLATSIMKEIRLVYSNDEFQCFGKLYSLDYRTIEDDINVEFNTLAMFKPHVCICVYNSRESFDYVKASLQTTDDNNFTLQDLPIAIVQAYNKNLSEKEQVILHERGQKIAQQLECVFVDIPFEYEVQDLFCRQQITRALESLGIEFNNDGRPLSEIMEPDLRVGMCLMCGDAFSAEIPLGPLLNSNPTQVRSDTNPSVTIEANLESTPDLTKQKIEVCCGSYHNFVAKIQKEEEEDVYHGFVLVFSPKRKASFCTMNAFADLLRRYWPSMPILILAITEIGASSVFFQDEMSQSLIQKAIKVADDLGIEYMTTPPNFQNQALVYNNFLKEVWQKREEINESYYYEATSPPAYDESMSNRPPAPLPKPYDAYNTKSSTSNSQSTEDSDPLYDQPSRYRHPSDSEPERPSSTSPPPFRADQSGEYAQNGEHLVKPSVIKRRTNMNAAWALNERRLPSKASTLPTDIGQNFHENGNWSEQSRHPSTGSRDSEETVWVENEQYASFYEMQRKSNLYSPQKRNSAGINAPLAKPEQIEIADYATVKDALGYPLIENDYASVCDQLPVGQLQRIKSTQRKAKDKNKLKTDRSNSPSEGSEGTGDDTIAILKKQRKRRSMKKGRSPGSSEGSRGAFSPQYSDDNFPGSPHGYPEEENPYDTIENYGTFPGSMTSSMDGELDLNSSGGWRRKKDLEKDTLRKIKKEEKLRRKEEERKQKELQKKQKKLHKKTDGRPGTSESGCRLVDFQMSSTNPSLPQYVETCVEFIREEVMTFVNVPWEELDRGINAEGIYRIPGNKQQVEILQLKLQEDPNVDIRSLDIQVNTVATVLKSFFKDTEPLIPPNLQEELLEAAEKYVENREAGKEPEIPEKSTRLVAIRGVLRKISPVNYEVLKYFITHLNELSQHKEKHSMDSRNLALCLWPTILRMDFSSYDKMAQSTKIPGEVIQTLIDQCGFFFHGEAECE